MPTLSEILAKSRGEVIAEKPSVYSQLKRAEVEKTSPLSLGQRTAIGLQNKAAQEKYLSDTYGAENVSIDPETGKWQIYDEQNDVVRPVDESGFSGGDIAESLGKVGVGAAQVPAALMAKIPTPVTMAGGAAISGGAETARQALGNLIAGKPITDIDTGEVKTEALGGAIAPAIGKYALPLIGKGIKAVGGKIISPITKQAEQKAVKAIAKGAEKAKIASKKASIQVADAIKGNLEEDTLRDINDIPYVAKNIKMGFIPERSEKITTAAAKTIKNINKSFDNIERKIYKSAGVTDNLRVPIHDNLGGMVKNIARIATEAISDEEEIAASKALKIIKKIQKQASKDGTISFGQAKTIANQLYDMADSNINPATEKMTRIGKLFEGMGHQVTKAKNSIPEIKGAAEKFGNIQDIKRGMRNMMRLNSAAGELRLESRIQNLHKSIGLKNEFKKIKDMMLSMPEMRKYGQILNKVNLAMAVNDIKGARAITPLGLGRLPGIKYLQQFTGVGDPESISQQFAGAAEKGLIRKGALSEMVDISETPLMPGIGRMMTKAKAYKQIFKEGEKKVPSGAIKGITDIMGRARDISGGALQKGATQVMPQLEKLGVRKVGGMFEGQPRENEIDRGNVMEKYRILENMPENIKNKPKMQTIGNEYQAYIEKLRKRTQGSSSLTNA